MTEVPEAWDPHVSHISAWHGPWDSKRPAVVADCMAPNRALAGTSYSPYGRSIGCPFPAPGWLDEALEEPCGGLKV